MKKNTKTIIRLTLLTAYVLFFGEAFVRLFAPQPLMPRYVTGAPYGIRANIPSVSYWHVTPEVNVEVRINEQGMRADREFSIAKPKSVYRIVLLGDSFFVGYEVALQDSFAFLLEKGLNNRGIKAEVLNLAVSGFGTAEELVELQERGLKFEPDLIILQWHSSDVADNRRSGLFRIDGDQLTRANSTFLPGIAIRDFLMTLPGYQWLIGNSHLYSAARERAARTVKGLLLRLRGNGAGVDLPVAQSIVAGTIPGYGLDAQLIMKIGEVAETNNGRLLVVDIPIRQKRSKFKSSLDFLPVSFLKKINYISPMDVFTQPHLLGQKIYYEKGHGHLTPLGNRLLTDSVLGWVLNEVKTFPESTSRQDLEPAARR